MHEFKTVEEIYNSIQAMDHVPKRIYVKLSKLKGNPEFIKFALESMLKNTPYASSSIHFIEVKPVIRCKNCGFEGEVDIPEHVHFIRCPFCNRIADVIKGNDIEILVKD